MLVELKNGQGVNGTLIEIDRFMNFKVQDAVITSKEGDTFHSVTEIFIKGSSIKSVQTVEGLLDVMQNHMQAQNKKKRNADHHHDETKERKDKFKKGKEEFRSALESEKHPEQHQKSKH